MTTLLHQKVEQALTGLLILPLRDLVIEYIGIIRVWFNPYCWSRLAKEGELTLRTRDHDFRIDINSKYATGFLGHSANWRFKCTVRFDCQHQPSKWTLIDPDENAIIGFE
jgi:hypothetical protein